MGGAALLLLFVLLGALCGFYVSVIGFAITSVVVCAVVGLASAAFDGPFTPLMLLLAFFAQQIGYFAAAVGRTLALGASTARPRRERRPTGTEIPAGEDHPR